MFIKIIGFIVYFFGLYLTFNLSKWNSLFFKYRSELDCPLFFIKVPILYWLIAILHLIFTALLLEISFFIIIMSYAIMMELGTYYAKIKYIKRLTEYYIKNEDLDNTEANEKAKEFVKYYKRR